MYEVPRDDERPGCRETWLITRAVFAVLLPPLAALVVMAVLITSAVVLFAMHPALIFVPVAVLVAGLYLFARWERSRFRPPEA